MQKKEKKKGKDWSDPCKMRTVTNGQLLPKTRFIGADWFSLSAALCSVSLSVNPLFLSQSLFCFNFVLAKAALVTIVLSASGREWRVSSSFSGFFPSPYNIVVWIAHVHNAGVHKAVHPTERRSRQRLWIQMKDEVLMQNKILLHKKKKNHPNEWNKANEIKV